MPITPHFDLSQTDTHIVIEIRVPHVRVSPEQVQVVLTDNAVLHFASPPYLLVLNFCPQTFHETAQEEPCAAQYDPTIHNGIITLELRKHTAGVDWPNLDLLGRFAPKRRGGGTANNNTTSSGGGGSRWLQSVQQGESNDDNAATTITSGEETRNSMDDDALDTIHEKESCGGVLPGYGFLRMFRGIYSDLSRDGLAKEMLEFPWEESGPSNHLILSSVSENQLRAERRRKRLEMELEKFCPERYLGDLDIEEDYIYQCAMAMKPHWQNVVAGDDNDETLSQQFSTLTVNGGANQTKKATTSSKTTLDTGGSWLSLTTEERSQLLAIPYPLLPSSITCGQEDALLVGLADILFAYVYDHLITDGDPTVESAWTVSILSASLSCLDDWIHDSEHSISMEESIANVVGSSLRRSLIYPYFRNLNFSRHVWKQVSALLAKGIRPVIRSLLQTRSILHQSEMYYMGNKLFVDPYLAWLQASPEKIEKKLCLVATSADGILRRGDLKDLVGLHLQELEDGLLAGETDASDNDASDDSSTDSGSNSSDSTSTDSSSSDSDDESAESDDAASADGGTASVEKASSEERANGVKVDVPKTIATSGALLDRNLGSSSVTDSVSILPTVEIIKSHAPVVAPRSLGPLIQELDSTKSD